MKHLNFLKRLDLLSVLFFGLAMLFGADAAMAMAATDDTADAAEPLSQRE